MGWGVEAGLEEEQRKAEGQGPGKLQGEEGGQAEAGGGGALTGKPGGRSSLLELRDPDHTAQTYIADLRFSAVHACAGHSPF